MTDKYYQYVLREDVRLDDNKIKDICSELSIENGILIVYRIRNRIKNKYTFIINGNYRASVYKNRYSSMRRFR